MSSHDFLLPLKLHDFRASWVGRVDGVAVKTDRDTALNNLWPYHLEALEQIGGTSEFFWRCEQTHSAHVGRVEGASHLQILPRADALITNDPSVTLGIYVADCAAIYVVDTKTRAIALIHSGRAGSEKNILGATLNEMKEAYGSMPEDLVVTLAPCIRYPAYDTDFAGLIKSQALEAGVSQSSYYDEGICTASDLEQFYSYRKELGKTGRMLALLSCKKK